MKPVLFGTWQGTDVLEVTLRSDAGASASVMSWGAVLRDLVVPSRDGPRHVVLGFDRFEDYPAYSPHFGANPGRVANRIGGASFVIDGTRYHITPKDGETHALHGGKTGFGKRVWTLATSDQRSATFVLVSEDGDMGFPGRVVATCTYRLLEPATLQVVYTATTDKPTPVNFAHHSYFNLDGSPDTLGHRIRLAADFYTPVDADLIPTGEILSVAGTPFDLREERPMQVDTPDGPFRFDHNFVLRHRRGTLGEVARVVSPKSGVALDCWSTEPGVQFYDAAKLAVPVPGLGAVTYGGRAGFCLEAQNFPDAVNKPQFPDPVLRPGEVYRQTTEYRFSVT